LKASLTIASEVTTSSGVVEIRENEWQGRDFSYPNIRVRLISNTPLWAGDCNAFRIYLGIQVYTEDASSLNCDRIAGIINSVLHDRHFSSNSIAFSLRTTNLVPAIRSNIQEWRAEVLMTGVASG
jgi:hypothetical protein